MHQLISCCACCPPACLSVSATCHQKRKDSPSGPGSLSFALCLPFAPCFIVPVISSFIPQFALFVTLLLVFIRGIFFLLSHPTFLFAPAQIHTSTSPSAPRVNVRRCLLPHMACQLTAVRVWVVSCILTQCKNRKKERNRMSNCGKTGSAEDI